MFLNFQQFYITSSNHLNNKTDDNIAGFHSPASFGVPDQKTLVVEKPENKNCQILDMNDQVFIERIIAAYQMKEYEDALTLTRMYFSFANDRLQELPYHQVTMEDRFRYTLASYLKGYLMSEGHGANDTEYGPCNTSKIQKEALKILDQSIIIAGAPFIRQEIDFAIDCILNKLDKLDPYQVQTSVFVPNIDLKNDKNNNFRCKIKEFPIDKVNRISWFSDYLEAKSVDPFIIRHAFTQDWPAFNLGEDGWNSIKFWYKKIHPFRTVPIELGSQYTDSEWKQSLVTFQEFLNLYMLPDAQLTIGYLAQYDLFHHFPEFKCDYNIPDLCFVKEETEAVRENVWIGPQNTISPFHEDPFDNMFVQVVGIKYFCLVKHENESILVLDKEGIMKNTSEVSVNMNIGA